MPMDGSSIYFSLHPLPGERKVTYHLSYHPPIPSATLTNPLPRTAFHTVNIPGHRIRQS
jgi:hypothetical protein